MIALTYTIETPSLLLRAPSLHDIPIIFSATKHVHFNDGMPWDPPQSEDEMIEPYKRAIKAWEDGKGYSFSIDVKPDLMFKARISIRKTDKMDRWNIGFWTHPAYQRKGIMKEAVAAVLKFGFEELCAAEIEACCATWNIASERVLQNNGFRFEKYLEEGFLKKGVWVAENLYSISKSNWKASGRTMDNFSSDLDKN